jgi:hypothetical protein
MNVDDPNFLQWATAAANLGLSMFVSLVFFLVWLPRQARQHEAHIKDIQAANGSFCQLQAATFREALERIVEHHRDVTASHSETVKQSIEELALDVRVALLRLEEATGETLLRRRERKPTLKGVKVPE